MPRHRKYIIKLKALLGKPSTEATDLPYINTNEATVEIVLGPGFSSRFQDIQQTGIRKYEITASLIEFWLFR